MNLCEKFAENNVLLIFLYEFTCQLVYMALRSINV